MTAAVHAVRPHPALGHTQLGDGAATWRVLRAWPGPDGALAVELDDGGSALGATVDRDGRLSTVRVDPALPTLAAWRSRPDATVVAHRPGRRAVVRLAAGDGRPERFVKLDGPTRRQRALDRLRAVDAGLAGCVDAPHRPRARAIEDDPSALELDAVSGRSFAVVLREGSVTEVRRAAAVIGRALTAMSSGAPAGLPPHGVDDEIDVMAGWVRRAVDHGAVTGAAAHGLRRRADEVAAALRRLPEGSSSPTTLAHRDVHDGQLLLGDDGRVTLLDWDTASTAPAALDLANLLAHVDRVAPGRPEVAAAAVEELVTTTAAGAHPAWTHGEIAIACWREAAAVRLVCVHAFRPH